MGQVTAQVGGGAPGRPRWSDLLRHVTGRAHPAEVSNTECKSQPKHAHACRMTRQNLTYLEKVYRLRLRTLRGVDETIERVVKQLDKLGVLDNTYIIFSSDNGYHLGTHRRKSGAWARPGGRGRSAKPHNVPHVTVAEWAQASCLRTRRTFACRL